jgi:hypothetical protein
MPAGPPPKKSKVGLFIGIGCGALLLLSCCITGGWWFMFRASEVEESVEDSTVTTEETGGGGGGGGDEHVCTRAGRCCEDYVNEMGAAFESARAACANYSNLASTPGAESSCQQTIDTYRSGLQAAGKNVPASCQ